MVAGWLTNDASQMAHSPLLHARFIASTGRQPDPGELERMVAEQALALGQDPNLHPDGVRYGATRLGQLLSTWHLQLVDIDLRIPGLVLPDHPIVHGRIDRGLFGFDAGPVGESDTVLVPITRRLAGFYSPTRLPDVRIQTKKGVDWVNSLLLRAAMNEVACHPVDALATARLIRNLDRYPPERFRKAVLR